MGPDSSFHRILWDDADASKASTVAGVIKLKPDAEIRRVVLCTGKVYYDLYEGREAAGANDVYILRVEQLYPFPARSLMAELARFPNAEVVWCQEEPRNMGAWSFIEPNIEWTLNHIEVKAKRARYIGRVAAASTATGQLSRHLAEQKTIVADSIAV